MSDVITVDKRTLLFSGVALILVAFGFILVNSANGANTTGIGAVGGQAAQPQVQLQNQQPAAGAATSGTNQQTASTTTANGAVQELTIGLGSGNYYNPKEIRVKVGTKVKLTADPNTLRGCMRTVIIQNYGSVTVGGAPLEFTANKAGTFRMSCPMGMGSGQLVVEDASGNVPGGNVAPPAPTGGSCGGGGGGCGCG